jgi:alpha-glucoside transport system substrate-binding protein
LIDLSDRLLADGQTPWCFGFASPGSDGWPGTDWIENLVLAEAGADTYDRWAFHDIPFDDPAVRRAFERLGEIVFQDGYVGTSPAQTGFNEAQLPMVERDPPGCWLYQFPSWAVHILPPGSAGESTSVFPFPTFAGADRPGVLGGGELVSAFADRPEIREFVRFLLSPAYGTEWAGHGMGFISANRRFELDNYPPFWRRQAELIAKALAADTFRFDASDLMPPEVGQDLFWDAMVRYLDEGPGSLDAILSELDAAWPDDTS